jgi:cell division protein ZapA
MKKPVEVEIMGQNVTVRSEEEESYVRRVAGYVDEKMQEVVKNTRPIAKFNVAVMAALNIADEYHRLKDRYDTMINRLDLLSKRLSITLTEEG